MSYITLSRPGVYVPPRGENDINVLTNHDLEQLVDTSDKWIIQRTGMKEGRISFDKDVKDMAVEASLDLNKKENINSEEIDEIIFATNRHKDEQEFPNHAGYAAYNIGARDGIPIHDQAAGCTGLVYAIREAYNNLATEKGKRRIRVIASEHLTDMTDYSDRNTCVLFGDAAVALDLVKHEGRGEGIIKNVVGGTPDINGYLRLVYKDGMKIRPSGDHSKSKFELYPKKQNYLEMIGTEIFDFAVPAMRDAVHKVFEGTGYSIEDLSLIIPHGANIRIVNAAGKRLKRKGFKGRIFTNLEKYRNTSSASVGLAMDEAIDLGMLKPGDLYCIVKFGAGLTWGASLIRHN